MVEIRDVELKDRVADQKLSEEKVKEKEIRRIAMEDFVVYRIHNIYVLIRGVGIRGKNIEENKKWRVEKTVLLFG